MSYWNEDRINLLRELYPHSSRGEIFKAFPEKNWNAISAIATRRGFKRRVPKHLEIKTYPILSEEVAKIAAWSIVFEGSIGLHKQIHFTRNNTIGLYPMVSLGNTDFELLEKFKNLLGFGHIGKGTEEVRWFYKNGNEYKSKPLKKWEIRSVPEIKYFLRQIVEYLPAKKRQGELLLEYTEIRLKNWRLPYTPREYEIQDEMKKLNERGF